MVTESTYGDRLHNVKEKPNYAADLARVIDETMAEGGCASGGAGCGPRRTYRRRI